jgi:ATP-dependent DNA helicase RecQ
MHRETNIKTVLKDFFGYENFRSLQEEVIVSVLAGNDNLVIMPTGGGKSICYQLPALLMNGLTLVISPLIALMKDQVDGLNANGISAAYVNSSQSDTEVQSILKKTQQNKIKLLYLAPESISLITPIIESNTIDLIAIDEAHCISSWGHDFRPAYTQLGFLKKKLPNCPMIALTATADKATREDISKQLNLKSPKKHIASFDRPNLSLEVRTAQDRISQIVKFIESKPIESGIIYCLSRKSTEQVADRLSNQGIAAHAYHAGIPHEERSKIQEDFTNDRTQIICATIAFGMGIDKSNIRWVIHYNLPKNMEGYYQEIGRSGRDGLPAETLLFYSYADVIQLKKFAENSGNKEVQLSKLERIQQYTEALSCRRKILLSYFGELVEKDCGNCDVCKNPPTFFDGTVLAQKILSAIYRLQEKEALGTVVDFLRGSQNAAIYDKQYQYLKTYGVAKEHSWSNLQAYIVQLLNQGYCEIAFHENNSLKLTDFSKKVLFEGRKVRLTKIIKTPFSQQKKIPKKNQQLPNNLFEQLRLLRLKISREKGIPPYLIFNDHSLKEMASDMPEDETSFLSIEGVGQKKLHEYGKLFITEILEFKKTNKHPHKKKTGNTLETTLQLIQQGYSSEAIALERRLNLTTIKGHFLKLYQKGANIELSEFVTEKEIMQIKRAKKELKNSKSLKVYYLFFEEQLPYEIIRFGLAVLERETI